MAPSGFLAVRMLGTVDYEQAWRAMQHFTDSRDTETDDELWLLQHPPVFTQGQAGKAEHLLLTGDIPVIQVDRGGQVTYHGPGQLVCYLLIDLKRRKMGVRELVNGIEDSLVNLLKRYQITANPRKDAPGVYLDKPGQPGPKIAQLGLRVRRGCSFHGLSLNVAMDLEPFARINPCGHIGLEVTDMAAYALEKPEMSKISEQMIDELVSQLGYNGHQLSSSELAVIHD